MSEMVKLKEMSLFISGLFFFLESLSFVTSCSLSDQLPNVKMHENLLVGLLREKCVVSFQGFLSGA